MPRNRQLRMVTIRLGFSAVSHRKLGIRQHRCSGIDAFICESKKIGTFVGKLESTCAWKDKSGAAHLLGVSDFPKGLVLTVFYIPVTSKSGGVKTNENLIFALSYAELSGKESLTTREWSSSVLSSKDFNSWPSECVGEMPCCKSLNKRRNRKLDSQCPVSRLTRS